MTADRWDEGFSLLKLFSEREGHCRVPLRYTTSGGYNLGSWVTERRKCKDTMEPEQQRRLESLPGWSWDVLADKWEEGFSQLKEYSDREGHCRVLGGYKTDKGFRLGGWVGFQRRAMDTMEPCRRQRLEALPGWCGMSRRTSGKRASLI